MVPDPNDVGSEPITILDPGDARVPPRESCTVRGILESRARHSPDRPFVVFADGTQWTYGEAWLIALRSATGLSKLGVGKGDRVVSWLPNGPTLLRTWFGANLLGAIHVPINTAFKGSMLEHVVSNARAKVAVVHPELLPLLSQLPNRPFESIITDGHTDGEAGVDVTGTHEFLLGDADPSVLATSEPWDTMVIIYTSGTTGPSKGVLSSYVHNYSSATAAFAGRGGPDERFMVNLPLFHMGGTLNVYSMMLFGGSVALVSGFDTRDFWNVVDATGTTSCTLLGVMTDFLLKEPASGADRMNTLRWVWTVPFTAQAASFGERFSVDVYTMFSMTEISCPLLSHANPSATGCCGTPRPGVEVRIVDENDVEVAPGEVGELIVRTSRPWAMNHGYHGMPEATAAAWRNGWFHTGDAMRMDDEGNYFFVDRRKDCIRRRGENISSFEVESEALSHTGILEAAAIGVPAPGGEEEVLLVVAPVEGFLVNPAELLGHLAERLPHFMVPRYIEVVPELPKTPTNKVQKHLLRAKGVTPNTWDREQSGIRVRRRTLSV